MRIQVTDVSPQDDGVHIVHFRSSRGTARARWIGRNHSPVLGRFYDVELDADLVVDAKVNMRIVAASETSISTTDNVVLLRVVVESADADGMAYLRLSADCLLMVEVAGEIPVGSTVEICIPPDDLTLTVTGVLLSS